jgi:drug/metabolite transporter (DMT)-like permease
LIATDRSVLRAPRRAPLPWQAQFVLLSMIWGGSFVSIKVLGRHWAPVDVALARVALGALTLLPVLAWRRERLPRDLRVWGHLAVLGILWNAIPFTLFAYGETQISSVLAGLWNATTPLLTLLAVLVAFPEEKPTSERMAGLGIGFLGVVLVLGPWRGLGGGETLGQLACLLAAACYGVVIPYTRRYLSHRPESGLALSAGQLMCATVQLALLAPLASAPTLDIGVEGYASVLALGALSTGVGFVMLYNIIRVAGTTTAATVPYLIPLFSTALGVIVLGEGLQANEPLGAVVVLAGIAVAQGRLRLRRRARR